MSENNPQQLPIYANQRITERPHPGSGINWLRTGAAYPNSSVQPLMLPGIQEMFARAGPDDHRNNHPGHSAGDVRGFTYEMTNMYQNLPHVGEYLTPALPGTRPQASL